MRPVCGADAYVGASSGASWGQPVDSAGAVMAADLGNGAEFRSTWMPKGRMNHRALVQFYGTQSLTLYIEETYDNPTGSAPQVHHQTAFTAESVNLPAGTGAAARYQVGASVRLLAPFWRINIVNGGSAQVGAKLFAAVTEAEA